MLRLPAHKRVRSRGFSMIEVITALAVLWVGVLCAEALGAKMLATGRQSRYMALASVLASEKLEDLNHYSPNDPQVCVPAGNTSVGNLNSDIMQSTTCAPGGSYATGFSATVTYYDNVSISLSNFNSDCPNRNRGLLLGDGYPDERRRTVYSTTYHSPDGQIVTPAASQHRAHERNVSPALDYRSESARHGDAAGNRHCVCSQDRPGLNFKMTMMRPRSRCRR